MLFIQLAQVMAIYVLLRLLGFPPDLKLCGIVFLIGIIITTTIEEIKLVLRR